MRTVSILTCGFALVALAACSPAPKPYTNAAWGFGASFRGPVKVTDTPAANGNPASFQAESTAGGRQYVIAVTDTSLAGKTPDQILAEAPQATADASGGTLQPATNVTAGKVAGREFVIKHKDAPTERDRVFVSNGKLYQLTTQSPHGEADSETTQFLTSFHLDGQ
jgi:hypothetical protein